MSHIEGKKLGWFLCWAIVFADIGTSLYYVPGILFGQVGNLAGLFVLMSSVVFILLVFKYIEITDRYPEGGGVVTVATHAFGPWFGALGGMFITVDYFLTASISSVSGFAYLNSVVNIGSYIVLFAILGIVLLGILNIIGIKESAGVTAVVATLAFIVDLVLVGFVLSQVHADGWAVVFGSFTKAGTLTPWALLTGFAGSFLAFSGLESISQLSPAMQTPRKSVATKAMMLVIFAVFITSPILTLFSTNLLNADIPNSSETILDSVASIETRKTEVAKLETAIASNRLSATEISEDQAQIANLNVEIEKGSDYSERFISELGAQYGGSFLKISVVATASVLLLFASNTAIIGAYHVFMSLSRQNFLPYFLQHHNSKFGTPHWAVALAVIPPIIIIWFTNGNVGLLGELYAFGLLGAFGLSSIGLDVVRWRENKKINLVFIIGIITSILVVVAWVTNLVYKELATTFGGIITIVGMIIAFIVYKYFPHTSEVTTTKTEKAVEASKGQILLPVYDEYDPSLFDYVAIQAKGMHKKIILVYIREFSDIYQTVSENVETDQEAVKFINKATKQLTKLGVEFETLYRATNSAGETINNLRTQIKPIYTILTPAKRLLITDFLKGNIVNDVIAKQNGGVLIYTGN